VISAQTKGGVKKMSNSAMNEDISLDRFLKLQIKSLDFNLKLDELDLSFRLDELELDLGLDDLDFDKMEIYDLSN
jgi:hypothetical protein